MGSTKKIRYFIIFGLFVFNYSYGQDTVKDETHLNKYLIAILDTVLQEDQQYRLHANEIEAKYGWESYKMDSIWKIIVQKDSINLIKVKKILNEYGWLGSDIIGDQGNLTLFLVIQHSDLETQEKYLPMMKEAVENGNAKACDLALLEDRIAMRNGNKQVYGSQITQDQETGEYSVYPLIDPDNVDKRRAEVGLGPLQDYVSYWGLTWDVKEYKMKLTEIEVKQNK